MANAKDDPSVLRAAAEYLAYAIGALWLLRQAWMAQGRSPSHTEKIIETISIDLSH